MLERIASCQLKPMYETRHRHTFRDTERVSLSFLTSGIKTSKEEGKEKKKEREKKETHYLM